MWPGTWPCLDAGGKAPCQRVLGISRDGKNSKKNPHGVTNVSLTKTALCQKYGLSTKKFDDLTRASYLLKALQESFGLGALLFCPDNLGGYDPYLLCQANS